MADPPDSDDVLKASRIPEDVQGFFNEAFLQSAPGIQLKEGIEAILNIKAVLEGDEVVASAIRVFQALCVAAKRKDAVARRAIASWERATFKYMRRYALAEYLEWPVPPRANLDRHVILDSLKDKISELLLEQVLPEKQLTPELFAITVGAYIRIAFSSYKTPDEDPNNPRPGVAKHLMAELEKHRFNYAKIDPDEMLRVGLQSNLGITGKMAQDWMRRRK